MIRTWAMLWYVEIRFPCIFGGAQCIHIYARRVAIGAFVSPATVGVAIRIILVVGELCMMLTKSPTVGEKYGLSLACAGRPITRLFDQINAWTSSRWRELP
ncbi:hypothetical protein VNO77_27502 [Canavalia gladiata]|uniref:Uncharacterized protein n=1 Tax=Canavalia gladiata TaxID=3824 RepID=A0AAN9KUT3_CANGL